MAKTKKKRWAIALPGRDAIKQKLEKHWTSDGSWQASYEGNEPYAVPTVEWHQEGAMHALDCEDGQCKIVQFDGPQAAKSKTAGGFLSRLLPSFSRKGEEPADVVARAFTQLHTGTFHVGSLETGHDAPKGARVIVKLKADD